MRIFGRETSRTHASLALICDEILHRSDLNDRAFAWNLIYDQRVNEDWAEYWYQEYGQPLAPGALRNSLIAYYSDLRARPLETYANIESRGRNFVRAGLPGSPAEGDSLVHVMDLWSPGARRIWAHGRRREIGPLGEISDIDLDAAAPPAAVVSVLQTATVEGQRDLMSAFFDANTDYLNTVEDERRRGGAMATLGCCWVALWDPWIRLVGDSAEDWCESVGLSKRVSQTPAWMAVVRYPVRKAKRLICPTQLEAQWYGRHFPTPPACSSHSGGRVVEGRSSFFSDQSRHTLREYLHAPVPLEPSDWLAAGFPVLQTNRPVGNVTDLARDRGAHWEALQREFPDADGWMSKPNPPHISLAI
jgi:hypothetical protein